MIPEPMADHDGDTYDPARDKVRLNTQLRAVLDVMRDGRWRTLEELVEEVDQGSATSISARVRDLRKEKFGGHAIVSERVQGGLWRYRWVPPEEVAQEAARAELPTLTVWQMEKLQEALDLDVVGGTPTGPFLTRGESTLVELGLLENLGTHLRITEAGRAALRGGA